MKRRAMKCTGFLCLCAILLGLSGGAYAAKNDWHTVQELREMTREGWHQTYETKWRTVQVDVDIEVPDVEAFPIIKVQRMQPIDVSKLELKESV